MPLVVLAGFPASGKSTRARELVAFLKGNGRACVLISEDRFELVPAESYKDSRTEKSTRGVLKAEVERQLAKGTTVIIDSLNYIKGYRYELYCLARAIPTPHCVIHCDVSSDISKLWNTQREEEKQFPPDLLEQLIFRFERPNAKNRWDKPCFVVGDVDPTPLNEIESHLYASGVVVPLASTLPQVISDTNYVFDMDRITQDIITAVLKGQNDGAVPGDRIPVPKASSPVTLSRRLSMAELRRLRRQFLKLSQMHPPQPEKTADVFVSYLNTNLT
eukprot:TRINITY_DN88_c1_g2_i1.p1 TRINITY_DN88_c1_g2~~TRINITY_DN88_c1_g2_i1.p1  ORF type:complete len:275 (-),score=51.54 TRINITY_DN88_c1_g2_i1:1-825(-)